jgi:chemotaxis protein methyltransferase CheR
VNTLRPLHRLVRDRVGLVLSEDSLAVERYMRERTLELGLADAEQFIQHLASEQLASEDWTKLIALATNPLTHFFRDQSQLESVVKFLEQAGRESPERNLQIWSAGCSTGEEPHTLAILCRIHGLRTSILATDVNPAVLSEGRRGVYAAWSLRHVEAPVVAQFFVPTADGEFAVIEDVRAQVQFAEQNLTAGDPPLPRESPAGWDLILCRNVLIYYALAERRAIVERLARAMRPGGVLFLGSSELARDYVRGVRPIVIAGREALVRTTEQSAPPGELDLPVGATHLSGEPMPFEPARLPSAQPARAPVSLADVQEHVVAEILDNRSEAARALLREVVAANPHDLAAHLSLGHLCVLVGDLEGAERGYEVAQRLDPLVHEAHLGLGVVRLRRGDLENAFTSLQRAVFLEPRFWATAYLLGEVAERLKLPQIAARELQRARGLLQAAGLDTPPLVTHPILHAAVLPARPMR